MKIMESAFYDYKTYVAMKEKEKEKTKTHKIDRYDYNKKKLGRIMNTLYSLTFKDQPNVVQAILEKSKGYDLY
jgi:hypothetical protein